MSFYYCKKISTAADGVGLDLLIKDSNITPLDYYEAKITPASDKLAIQALAEYIYNGDIQLLESARRSGIGRKVCAIIADVCGGEDRQAWRGCGDDARVKAERERCEISRRVAVEI